MGCKTLEVISTERIKELNREKGLYFFSLNTMRFFKSRVGRNAYKVGDKAYFITSEQYESNPRKWTIRVADLTTGSIDTVGEFQEFNSHSEALNHLKRHFVPVP